MRQDLHRRLPGRHLRQVHDAHCQRIAGHGLDQLADIRPGQDLDVLFPAELVFHDPADGIFGRRAIQVDRAEEQRQRLRLCFLLRCLCSLLPAPLPLPRPMSNQSLLCPP